MYPSGVSFASRRLGDYAILLKLRLTVLFVVTAWAGYYLGLHQIQVPTYGWGLVCALLGIGSIIGGSAALNQVIEREADAGMLRTQGRPLPAHRLGIGEATAIGMACIIGGATFLSLTTNVLTGLLSLLGAAVYLVIYTPGKKHTLLCTAMGALAGAMPPLLGWTAARGRLGSEALALSAILFLWQLPHFYSIEWLYRSDYKCAGMRMLSVIEEGGRWTGFMVLASSLMLVPVSLLPVYLRIVNRSYGVAALILSLGFLLFSIRFALALRGDTGRSDRLARELLGANVVYLPLLFGLMIINAS
jgi:protoheme IX farnesyltransferase